MGMALRTKRTLFLAVYLLFIFGPLIILLIGPRPAGREFWREISVGIGFFTLGLMGLQTLPAGRLPFLRDIYPMDIVYTFHHRVSVIAFFLALAHPIILFINNPATLRLLNFESTTWRARAGVLGIILLIFLVLSSVWRKDFQIPHENWRTIHDIFVVAMLGFVLVHIFLVGYYTTMPLMTAFWIAMAILWIGMILWIRLFRPLKMLKSPYILTNIKRERERSFTLTLKPDGHPGLRFFPGQFAWISFSAFSIQENPFSFTSSSQNTDEISFTIREAGDFTERFRHMETGKRIFVDGPYGNFSIDQFHAPGYVMLAGGIGSAPFMSMIRTMIDRKDDRPVWFFYGNPTTDDIIYWQELDELKQKMNLTVIHVLEQPDDDWEGESGFINQRIMEKYLPEDERNKFIYFLCGPVPMIEAVEKAILKMGVPQKMIYTEQYDVMG
jgi:3-phenylpropionate/trans-cinnamate dioxygenase ferredoxin reductase subunit